MSECLLDINMKANHSFFVISHGESTCDGLGKTIKIILQNASPQLPDKDQIMTATAAYKFCKEKTIKNIKFHFIYKKMFVYFD